MAHYCVIDELRAMEFHDSILNAVSINGSELRMVFSDAIITGRSFPEKDRIRCSVNDGEDRYACPHLTVTFHEFETQAIIKLGFMSQDAQGNIIAQRPTVTLAADEHDAFWKYICSVKVIQVNGLSFDEENGTWTLCILPDYGIDCYEVTFCSIKNIAEFDEFGKEAWYLDSKWRNQIQK